MWSEAYQQMINRNIGLLTEDQQNLLQNTTIALFGLGGLGGVIAEILTRSGIGSIKLVDNDKFDKANLNRQIFAFHDTLGRWKTDVTEEFLTRINPEIKLEKYNRVEPDNIQAILKNAKLVILAIDSAKPCVIVSRAARALSIPLVEGWAIPYGNTRVFTADSPTLEAVYNLPTQGKPIDAITDEEFMRCSLAMLMALKKIEGVGNFYPPAAIDRIQKGQIPSFAPIVWLTAVLMSFEALKIIVQWGQAPVAPEFFLYNPFDNSIPRQEV